MTEGLKEFLRQCGVLTVTLHQLARERPGTQHASLEEYYRSLGALLPDEPILVVRISRDGETRFLKEGAHDIEFESEDGEKLGVVTVLELPEDEYWFFQAFRPAIFDLDRDLPAFIYGMAVVHAYAMFEAYLSDLLRERLRTHPRLMGAQRQVKYEEIFDAPSKADLIDTMIEREVRDLTYLPVLALLQKMRDKLGFRNLTDEYDDRVNRLGLVRNCLMHNAGRVDDKLSRARPDLHRNEKLVLTIADVGDAVGVLRKFAYEIDRGF
jgi:hypothetical protein